MLTVLDRPQEVEPARNKPHLVFQNKNKYLDRNNLLLELCKLRLLDGLLD